MKGTNGAFLKDKFRIVTLSQVRYLSTIGTATLPHYLISFYDINGAFLNSSVPEDVYKYARVDSKLSVMLIDRYPHLTRSLNNNGLSSIKSVEQTPSSETPDDKLHQIHSRPLLCANETSRKRDNLSHSACK